jgi:signal peptidase II
MASDRADVSHGTEPTRHANAFLFWGVIVAVVLLDVVSKALAVNGLSPAYTPHEIVGDFVRFTLAYNPGAAFGLNLGAASRWIFTALTLVALGVLGALYRATRPAEHLRTLALALVSAGAIGNLIDRLRWSVGVVDWIDVGIGTHRFWTFNVADSAVSVGAILLGWVLLQADREAARVAASNDA